MEENPINKKLQLLLFIAFCFIAIPAVNAQTGIAGVYENFTVGKESGDLEGMRVVLVSAGSGYHAIVQIAQGGAEDPEPQFVPVTVKGKNIEFAVGELKYKGTVTATGLTLKDADGMTHIIKRKPCATYFK